MSRGAFLLGFIMVQARSQGRILAGFHGLELPPQMVELARSGALAGLILFRRNIKSPGQLATLMAQIKEAFAGQLPPLLGIDQEGGLVQRLREPELPVARVAPMGQLARNYTPQDFEALGYRMGQEIRHYGFNLNFAPVLDIHTNPHNPIIGERAFGQSPDEVIANALAFARGLSQAKVIWCGKHFPGHGDTDLDSHVALPRLSHSLERLHDVELKPFAAAVASAPMLMSAHIIFEALCPMPATLSPRLIPELLRGELGFEGVVASDDLEMAAIAKHYSISAIADGLEAASIDLALVCSDLGFASALAKALPPNPVASQRLETLREQLLLRSA